MKKFLSVVVILFIFMGALLSGCNLVQMNSLRFYDKVVAKIGDIEITKLKLVNSYYSASQSGYSYSADDLLEELINRELLIDDYISNHSKLEDMTNKLYYNQVMKEVYAYVDGQILNNENSIRTAKGMEKIEDEGDTEEAEPDYAKESPYEKKVIYNEITGGYDKVLTEDDFETEVIAPFSHKTYGDTDMTNLAYTRFIQGLIRSEEGKGLDKNPTNVLQREMDRVYEILAGNKYLELIEKEYNDSLSGDYFNDAIVDKYKELTLASYSKYQYLGSNGYKTYVSDMQSDAAQVYYHMYDNDDSKGFLQVAHVLIKFTDDQLTDLTNIKNDYATGVDDLTTYESRLETWKQQASGRARQDGNEQGEPINYTDIYNEIKGALDALGNDIEAKAVEFNKFLYKYGQDGGSLNATKYYSVSLDEDVTENWVEGFGETAREIYRNSILAGGDGSGLASEPLYVNSSNYSGYHIIFVIGKYKNNVVNIDNISSFDSVKKLYDTKLMLGTDKTLFDSMYDLVSTSGFTAFRQAKIDQLREGKTIIYDRNAYKDLA